MVGQYDKALVDFDKVVRHYPKHANTYFRRGFVHKSLGDFEKCAEDLEMACGLCGLTVPCSPV